MLHYGLDVHRKYTNYCVMDDAGLILIEGKCPTDELGRHPPFALKGEKRAVLEAGGNWHFVYDMLEAVVDEVILAHHSECEPLLLLVLKPMRSMPGPSPTSYALI